MKLLVIAALAVVAAADRPSLAGQSGTPVYRYGTSSGTQSRYTAAPSSAGYGLKSRRRPFQSTLKPINGGYPRENGAVSQRNGAFNFQANGGYRSQANGGFSSQTNGGYNSQGERDLSSLYTSKSTGGFSSQTNGGGSYQSSGAFTSLSAGGYSAGAGGRQSAPRPYTPRYSGSFSRQPAALSGRFEPTPAPRPYSFTYDVLDVFGNDYGAAEASNGEQVQGQYSVVLPDGRLQTVSYTVEGDSGFVADVQYEGEALFPESTGAEQGRGSVTSGAGPDGKHGYRRN